MTSDEADWQAAQPAQPLMATSLFCDEIRMEASSKLLLIGCYPGNVIVLNPGQPIDRVSVLTKIVWSQGFDPGGLRLRVDLPAQDSHFMQVQPLATPNHKMLGSAVCIWALRLLPLRAGDLLRVGLEHGDVHLPCGELLVMDGGAAAAQVVRH
jgi:hypothetical protein